MYGEGERERERERKRERAVNHGSRKEAEKSRDLLSASWRTRKAGGAIPENQGSLA